MQGYDFYLNQILAGIGPVEAQEGGSGYFSKPGSTLDPRLFNGEQIRPEVRSWLIRTLYDYWSTKFNSPQSWSQAWIAGSGISYQWAADRSNGDLDILIGVDFPEFYRFNREYVGLSENELADIFNSDFKENLWVNTSETHIGVTGKPNGDDVGDFSGVFEVTFYVNPRSTDIRDINPYAAYNLTTNKWTVRPPELPDNPETLYPKEYWDYVHDERRLANSLISRYNHLSSTLDVHQPGSPGFTNNLSQMGLIVDQAKALFDDIHLGRKQAFNAGGKGYGDFYNFRWQAHKRFGTVQALNSLGRAKRAAKDAQETALYGKPIDSAEKALTTAALWNFRRQQ